MVIVTFNPLLNVEKFTVVFSRIGLFAVLRYECLDIVRHGKQWGVLSCRLTMVEFGPLFLESLEN